MKRINKTNYMPVILGAALLSAIAITGCGSKEAEDTALRIGSLKGPTSIGLSSLMHECAAESEPDYTFDIEADASTLLTSMLNDEIDIALIPANAAAIWYQKLDGDLTVLNINTLGVLYCVSDTSLEIDSVEDLAGCNIYMTGKGTTPEYVLDYILEAHGLDSQTDVNISFYSEAGEVVSMLSAADLTDTVAILPQPYVTVAEKQMDNLTTRLSLSDEWDAVTEDGAKQVTGVTVVRASYAEEHPRAIKNWIQAQSDSVNRVNADPAAASEWVVEAGIIEKAPIAQAAIPYCNLTCMTSEDMKTALSGYLSVLYEYDPSCIGGAMPGDDFYYMEEE